MANFKVDRPDLHFEWKRVNDLYVEELEDLWRQIERSFPTINLSFCLRSGYLVYGEYSKAMDKARLEWALDDKIFWRTWWDTEFNFLYMILCAEGVA